MNRIARALVAALIAYLPVAASAQVNGGVTSVGPIVPGHIATFKSKAQVQDGGAAIISGSAAGGDLGGTYPNPDVLKLQGNPLAATNPVNGQCIVYSGTFPSGSWGPGPCVAGGAGTVTSVALIAGTGLSLTGTCTSVTIVSCTFALTNVITAAGPIGDAANVAQITYDAQGRLTAVTSIPISIPFSQLIGSLACAQLPVFTTDISNANCAMTIVNGVVSNIKLANMAAATVKGTIAGGVPSDLSPAQITANFCNLATGTLKGCIIALTNNALQYLGGDGAWHFAQPYNPVTFYGMVCDGSTVTGNAAALQAAINAQPATGGPVNFPRGICNFDHAAQITITGHPNTSFEGLSNANSPGAATASVLNYVGVNTARVIDARDGVNFTINNLSIYSSSSALVAPSILIDSGATVPVTTISNGLRVSNFWIGATYTGPAPICLNISEAYDVRVSSGQFSRCSPAIKGQNVLGQNTTVNIVDVLFTNHVGPAIVDCGEAWHLNRISLEPDSVSGPNGFSNNAARPCKGMVITALWTGDTGAHSGTWFTITANGLTVTGGSFGNGTVDFALVGGSGYNFQGVRINGTTTFITCSSNPTGIRANGNVLESVTNTNTGSCLDAQAENNTPVINFPLPFWTPTWTPSGGAYPTTTNLGYYRLHGNGIEYYIKVVFGTVTATGATFVGGFPFAPALDCAIAGTDDNASQHVNGLLRAANFSAGLFKTSNPASTPAFGTASNVGLYANCRL